MNHLQRTSAVHREFNAANTASIEGLRFIHRFGEPLLTRMWR